MAPGQRRWYASTEDDHRRDLERRYDDSYGEYDEDDRRRDYDVEDNDYEPQSYYQNEEEGTGEKDNVDFDEDDER